jgi:hypothetical protein
VIEADSARAAGRSSGRDHSPFNGLARGDRNITFAVQAPTKYETVLNLKTAKALALEVPSTLSARNKTDVGISMPCRGSLQAEARLLFENNRPIVSYLTRCPALLDAALGRPT